MARISKCRSAKGSLAATLILVLLLGSFAVGALAVDVAHGVLVRSELQTATEAGALSGARYLAKNILQVPADATTAETYARNVTRSNFADAAAVDDSRADTVVTISVQTLTNPRTVTVTATKTIPNLFARVFGWGSSQISARAKAGAWQGTQGLSPGQALNLAVSIDANPSKGPQANKPLYQYVGPKAKNTTFTIVLNPQNNKNAGWLTVNGSKWGKEGQETNNPQITFGSTAGTMNGVQASAVQGIKPGQTLLLPIVDGGGAPFNNNRTIIGATGFKVTAVNFPQNITGYLVDPTIVRGIPGLPVGVLGRNPVNDAFLLQWQPWKVMLLE